MTRSPMLIATSVLLAGCASAPPDEPRTARTAGTYAVSATVLESPGHGAQLCNAVQDSYPPQCGG
jgi:hypothetical protein